MWIQDISCIKDLTFLYEVATIEDIYLAYDQLKVDENSLYSCIGIAGAQDAQDVAAGVVMFLMSNIESCFVFFPTYVRISSLIFSKFEQYFLPNIEARNDIPIPNPTLSSDMLQ